MNSARPEDGDLTRRVLLLAPSGRDAEVLSEQMRRRGFAVRCCGTVEELCQQSEQGVGTLFIAEEALVGSDADCLLETLARQEPWSDVPLIIMADSGETSAFSRRLERLFHASSNVTLLERPLRLITLYSVVASALRARGRQYELRDRLQDLERAVRQRDQFLAMLGHELRNPLAAVTSALAILRKFGNRDPELAGEQIDLLTRQVSHMGRLVDDLLDVARITSGKVSLDLQPVDLREIARKALQALNLVGPQRHDVVFETPGTPVIVDGDAVRLEQIISNLLTNAAKYTPEGGRVCLSVHDGEAAVLRVTDTGEGIAPAMLSTVFEPFTQAEQTLARSRGGLGMGLAVVKGLVEMHGGTVSISSGGPNLGTEVVVRLPISRTLATAEEAPAEEQEKFPAGRILVVEDNPDTRRSLGRLLELLGHAVETAEDGREGLEKGLARKPDAVLLDIGLPELSGYEVCRRLREAYGPDLFIAALTGYGEAEARRKASEAGFDLHLVKPIHPDRILAILSEWFAARRSPLGSRRHVANGPAPSERDTGLAALT